MIERGFQLTCSGCGDTTFIQSNITPRKLSFKTGTHVVNHNKEQSESWVMVHELFDLCPRCAKIYEKMLCGFYEECTQARTEAER